MITFINSTGLGSWHFDDNRFLVVSLIMRSARARKNNTTVDLLPPDDLDCLVYSSFFNCVGEFSNNSFSTHQEVGTFWNFECNNTKRSCFSYHWSDL